MNANANANANEDSIAIAAHFAASLRRAAAFDQPFRHFFVEDLLPLGVVAELARLPITAPQLAGLSGRREYHNAARAFVTAATSARFPVFARLAAALQSEEVVTAIATLCGTPLADTFLRIEYAADGDGFWLEPHTDLGVKKFTCFIALAEEGQQAHLGTDLYDRNKTLCKRLPFLGGAGLIFVPGTDSWHGFAPRPITGCRRSLIVNFVGPEWRSREQLAFPQRPVRC